MKADTQDGQRRVFHAVAESLEGRTITRMSHVD